MCGNVEASNRDCQGVKRMYHTSCGRDDMRILECGMDEIVWGIQLPHHIPVGCRALYT